MRYTRRTDVGREPLPQPPISHRHISTPQPALSDRQRGPLRPRPCAAL